MLGRLADYVEPLFGTFAGALHRLGLRPNHVTILSLALGFLAAASFVLVTNPALRGIVGGAFLLCSGLFDAFDGPMARRFGEESAFGAFLDSVLDRIAEITVYGAIVFANLVNPLGGIAALGSSLMVSYTRSRAEHLGAKMKGVGLAERPERLIILAAAAFIQQLNAGAILVAVLSSLTVVQRIALARRNLMGTKFS